MTLLPRCTRCTGCHARYWVASCCNGVALHCSVWHCVTASCAALQRDAALRCVAACAQRPALTTSRCTPRTRACGDSRRLGRCHVFVLRGVCQRTRALHADRTYLYPRVAADLIEVPPIDRCPAPDLLFIATHARFIAHEHMYRLFIVAVHAIVQRYRLVVAHPLRIGSRTRCLPRPHPSAAAATVRLCAAHFAWVAPCDYQCRVSLRGC